MVFYASQFNGHMFSHQDWESKYQDLDNTLSADDILTPTPKIWFHIGYDSPWTPAEKRRNEIWIPQGQVDETKSQIIRGVPPLSEDYEDGSSTSRDALVGCPWC